MKKIFNKPILFSTLLTTLLFTSILVILRLPSSIPLSFFYLELGKNIGYFPDFILVILLLVIPLTLIRIIPRYVSIKKGDIKNLETSINRKTIKKIIIFSFAISLLIIFSLSFLFISIINQDIKKTNEFTEKNSNLPLQEYTLKIASFLNQNINASYNKAESSFEIDNRIYLNLIDPHIMNFFEITRADIIIFQRWGACEQAAILIEELLHKAGYETRQGHFIDWDHAWAEVKNGSKWLIVDPWYIGNLVEIDNLKELKPEFKNPTSVEVRYRNGTIIDLGKDYGY